MSEQEFTDIAIRFSRVYESLWTDVYCHHEHAPDYQPVLLKIRFYFSDTESEWFRWPVRLNAFLIRSGSQDGFRLIVSRYTPILDDWDTPLETAIFNERYVAELGRRVPLDLEDYDSQSDTSSEDGSDDDESDTSLTPRPCDTEPREHADAATDIESSDDSPVTETR